jgi:hypothetical protein
MAGHKRFSLHGAQRLENHGVPHSAATNMTLQHTLALFFGIHANRPFGVYAQLRLGAMLEHWSASGRVRSRRQITGLAKSSA